MEPAALGVETEGVHGPSLGPSSSGLPRSESMDGRPVGADREGDTLAGPEAQMLVKKARALASRRLAGLTGKGHRYHGDTPQDGGDEHDTFPPSP